ncbi:MAG: hypothetical protein ACK4WC_13450 [Rubrimonas sp.]
MAFDQSTTALPSLLRAIEATAQARGDAAAMMIDQRPYAAALRALHDALSAAVMDPARMDDDAAALFVSHRLRRVVGLRVQAKTLFDAFNAFAADQGHPAQSPHAVAARLRDLGLRKHLSGGRTYYMDVTLADGAAR